MPRSLLLPLIAVFAIVPLIILALVLLATRFATDSRDGRDWYTPPLDHVPTPAALARVSWRAPRPASRPTVRPLEHRAA